MDAIACPRCHAPAMTAPEMRVAQCAACALVFEVSGAEFEPFDEANPPEGVEVRRDGDTLVLTLPWAAEVTYAGHFLQFTAPVGLTGLLLAGATSPARPDRAPADPLVLIGVASSVLTLLLYMAVCYVVNRTTVRIGPHGVSVGHGPLPTHARRASLPVGGVAGLRARTVMVRVGRRSEVERYTLDGPDGVVLAKWNREAPVRYVLGAIRATLLATDDAPRPRGAPRETRR